MGKRVAILSDVHGNWAALEAVAGELDRRMVNEVWCLGDTLGYLLDVREVLDWVRKKCRIVLAGNHDFALVRPETYVKHPPRLVEVFSKTFALLTDEEKDYLYSLKINHFERDCGCLLAHASFFCNYNFPYLSDKKKAKTELCSMFVPLQFVGHCHLPFVVGDATSGRMITMNGNGVIALPKNGKNLVCVGSVGQPRDRDCRACFVIVEFNTDETLVEVVRVDYDVESAYRTYMTKDVPHEFANRLFFGI
ncbi:MAG: metallophosphoesterase family protein [Patescibacteria group bacterium]